MKKESCEIQMSLSKNDIHTWVLDAHSIEALILSAVVCPVAQIESGSCPH